MKDNIHELVIIRGEDQTRSVRRVGINYERNSIFVVFNNNKIYNYAIGDVLHYTKSRITFADNRIILKDGAPLYNVEKVLDFGPYTRILYKSGFSEVFSSVRIKIVSSVLEEPAAKNTFEYLRQIAVHTGLVVDGRNILAAHYEKIDFIRDDSVLASFLTGKYPADQDSDTDNIVYPFGFNLSQKKAVENAIKNRLSVIEGPPGTGKTQTILNIISNAVMRNQTVAVVSSNNSATANVLEKLKKYGVDFIAAPLGNTNNKEDFIRNQQLQLPDMSLWKCGPGIAAELKSAGLELDSMLAIKNELSGLNAELDAIEKEHEHYKDYYSTLGIPENLMVFLPNVAASTVLRFSTEYSILQPAVARPGIFKKLSLRFSYGIKKFAFWGESVETVTAFCQNTYYVLRRNEIKRRAAYLKRELSGYDFSGKMKDYTLLSVKAFKGKLHFKYGNNKTRKFFYLDDLWRNPTEFMNEYPVVLSTTYSLRSSLSSKTVYDYVIMDEASQVDLATGALALSCAKKAVIVGDLKQLPNVVTSETAETTDKIFGAYILPEAFRYRNNSILSSVVKLFPKVPRVLLKEHYRCHPEIIGFCNQRFYNGELIVLSEPKSDRQPLAVYRTAPGNHARGHVNQRQIDVIKDEVIPQQNISTEDETLGIVTPYRNQAEELQRAFEGTGVKADTADKFQGQERSVIIFSTVDNEIGDFASDPNRLNVAVSRAVDQFIVVTDGNDNDSVSPIHELIGYIQYHNHEIINSEIHSVFDYLYSRNAEAREAVLRKHGMVAGIDSENLMYGVIKAVLTADRFSKYGVVMHVPLRQVLSDLSKLDTRELTFVTNHLTHLDFLIYSKLTHLPVLAIEVDGFAYHNNEKQKERDAVKDTVLRKYGIPILRLSTVGSREREKLIGALSTVETQ